MAHTIDHEKEAYEIQREIEQRDNRHLNTGKNHLSYATKIAKSLLPDPKSFQDMSEYLLDMKTGIKVGTKLGGKPGAVIGGLGYPIGKRIVGEGIPTLDELLGGVFKRKQWQPALVEAGTGAVHTPTPTNVKPVTHFKLSAIPNTENIGGEGIVKPTKLTPEIKELLKDVDPDLARRDIAKRYADNPDFLEKLIKLHGDARKYVDGPGEGRLAGFPKEGRTITAPDGIEYRIRDSNPAGGKGKFSINQDISARNTNQIRKIARQSDEDSLLKHFKKYVPKNKAKEALESYKTTSQQIYKALESARKRYNIKLTKKGIPKSEHATVEHIFDVDFYKRLKDEVPGFKGKGADEAWNLKMISFALNSKTGALNKKVKDIGQLLIEAVKKDEFIDYDKVVKEFVQNKLGTKINKLKPKDWDRITEFSMKNPNLNMHQILLEYTKNL